MIGTCQVITYGGQYVVKGHVLSADATTTTLRIRGLTTKHIPTAAIDKSFTTACDDRRCPHERTN